MQRTIETSRVRVALQVRDARERGWSTLNQLGGHRDNQADYRSALLRTRDQWIRSGYFAGAEFRVSRID